MKKIILIFTIILPIASSAQAVDHFVNDNSEWYVARVYPNASPEFPNFVETRTTYYGFLGDSLINGNTWLKLYSSWDTLFTFNLHYKGLIHSSEGIVLFQDIDNNLDTLYNFNLEIGDSVFFDFGFAAENIAIIGVDSIQINDLYFKRLTFDEPTFISFENLNEKWIEGIGSIHGPIFPHEPKLFSSEIPDELDLTCSYTNDIQYWNNSSYDDCFVNIILGIGERSLDIFNIFPNPFKDFIIIEKESHSTPSYYLEIYNSQGQKVQSQELINIRQRISLDQIPVGIYYFKIYHGNQIQTKKISKLY
jgi:hypothetical protein